MSPPPPPSLLLPPWRCQNATSSAQRVLGSALGVPCAGPCARAAVAVADSSRARIAKIGPCMGSLIVLQNEKEAGRRQRRHPDPIEIDPPPTQKCQAQPFIDQARDCRRDGKHGACMEGHG